MYYCLSYCHRIHQILKIFFYFYDFLFLIYFQLLFMLDIFLNLYVLWILNVANNFDFITIIDAFAFLITTKLFNIF
jgi:hypothetical protein